MGIPVEGAANAPLDWEDCNNVALTAHSVDSAYAAHEVIQWCNGEEKLCRKILLYYFYLLSLFLVNANIWLDK